MKIFRTLFVFLLAGCAFTSSAQELIFRKTDVEKSYDIKKKGPNRAQFTWLEINLYGTNLVSDTDDFRNGFGNRFGLSLFRKYKINGLLGHGFGVGYIRETFAFNDQSMINLGKDDFDKGRLILNALQAHYFLRFNFDPKRGDIVGTYIDLGIFGQFNFSQKQRFKKDRVEETHSAIAFPERYAAGCRLSFGRTFYSIYAQYKFLSEQSRKTEVPLTDLNMPLFSVGLNIFIPLN